jgi:hypothetical protein
MSKSEGIGIVILDHSGDKEPFTIDEYLNAPVESVLTYTGSSSSNVPQLGFDAEQSRWFDDEIKKNFPKILEMIGIELPL